MGELIAVLSGKGGTGKTSVCAGIASALAYQGERVLCIDCDIGLRNLDIALGLSDEGSLSFLDVCRGDYNLTDAPHHPELETLQFLTAPMGCAATGIDTESFFRMLRQAKEQFRYVFLDAPAGIEAGFHLAARHADRVLLVTGPDPAAVRDAARAAEVLELMGKKNIRLVVNRINKKLAAATKTTVDDIMDRSGLPLMGVVPEDTEVTLAAVYRTPLILYSRKGAAAKACCRIAKRIQGFPTPIFL
jgi:septum site-determining protein MinD